MKKNSGKAPSYQMYFRDWNEDPDLKLCSYAAEGLWIRLVNTSCEMPVKGVFIRQLNRTSNRVETEFKSSLTPLKEEEILSLIRGNTREKQRLFSELKNNNIIKQFEDGEYKNAFYCKRIHKDMQLREIRKQAGMQGGNPNLVKNLDKQNNNQNPDASTSSSISTSIRESNKPSLSDVKSFFKAEKLKANPDVFFNWYESKGWPNVDWRGLARVWESRERTEQSKPDLKICIACRAEGEKFQLNSKGEKVYICTPCLGWIKKMGVHNFGKLSADEIEKLVLQGKAKR